MTDYQPSASQQAFMTLASARMARGQGAVLLLEGPPGGGKTSFAKALACRVGGGLYYYAAAPDRERDLLYEIDVAGVVRRENAWVAGPAWQAFDDSAAGKPAVLLVDELDKASPGFDAFLLRLLEEWTFRSPEGAEVHADPAYLAVVLTSNGRRELRPEVQRRAQRVHVPRPEPQRLRQIVQQIATGDGGRLPCGLVDVLLRVGDALHKHQQAPEQAPSPKELAMAGLDCVQLAQASVHDLAVWREVAASWLVKGAGADAAAVVDKAVPGWKWARALRTESQRTQGGQGQ